MALGFSATALADQPAAGNMGGSREHKMVNCPSTVPGAETKVVDSKDGYSVEVVAKGANAIRQIRARARTQESSRAAKASVEHTGEGTGVGVVGYCPIVHVGTKVAVKDIPSGVRITVKSTDKSKVEEIQKLAHQRADAIAKN